MLDDYLGDSTPVRAVPDCEELELSPIPMKDRAGVLFIGSFHHAPNVQAAEFLCRQIMPLIDSKLLERHPVYIVGDGLNDTVRSFAEGNPHVKLVGWVPSVIPYLQRARVSILPLLYGAGTKRKLVQALMTGTPTVSTSVGTEGLALTPGEHVMVADDAEGLARRRVASCSWTTRLASGWRRRAARRCSSATAAPSPRKRWSGPSRTRWAWTRSAEGATRRGPGPVPASEWSTRRRSGCGMRCAKRFARWCPKARASRSRPEGRRSCLRLDPFTAWQYPSPDLDGAGPKDERRGRRGCTPGPGRADLQGRRVPGDTGDFGTVARGAAPAAPVPRVHIPHRPQPGGAGHRLFACTRRESWHRRRGAPSVVPSMRSARAPRHVADTNGARGRRRRREADRVLPAAVPPDPRERRVVGRGLHRVDERGQGRAAVPGPLPAAPAGRPRLLRPAAARGARGAGGAGARPTASTASATTTTGSTASSCSSGRSTRCCESGEPDFPFCLCWANEPWSRRWDGRPHDVLQPQSYSAADDVAHIRWLLPALADPRAITIDGKPVFLVYQAQDLPDPARTVDIWREEVAQAGPARASI